MRDAYPFASSATEIRLRNFRSLFFLASTRETVRPQACRAGSQKSIDTQSCLFDRVRMSQHREQHVDLFGEFSRGFGKCSAGTEQRLCFGASAIEHDQ